MLCLVIVVFLVVLTAHCGHSCELATLSKWATDRIQKLGGCNAIAAGGDLHGYKQAPKAKLFLYTNDEWEVLPDFLQYYSYIFGASNVVVIDQNSKMEPVCKTLALFQACGATIVTENESFDKKEVALTREMLKYNDTFLIPLDTDEFILSYADSGDPRPVVDRNALWRAFANLPIDGRKYKYGSQHSAVPEAAVCSEVNATRSTRDYRRLTRNNRFFPPTRTMIRTKTFFHSEGFMSTDAGNHYGQVKHDHGRVNIDPMIENSFPFYFAPLYAPFMHFGVGSYLSVRDKYARASVQMGFTDKSNCAEEGRTGGHYCPLVKDYVYGPDKGVQRYTTLCKSWNAKTYTPVAEWFLKNTLTVHQLTEA